MEKLKTKIFSSLSIASLLLTSSMSFVYADENTNTIKDVSGTGNIAEIINKYEDYLKNTKDNKRLDKLLKEKEQLRNKNISDDLKNEIINNTIYKAKKQRLDADSELAKIKDKKLKDRALGELKKANKTTSTYRFLVKTSLVETELKETLAFFDKAEVLFLNADSEGKNIFEINFPLKGKFANALANYVEAGQLPDVLFDKVEIIKPTLIKQIGAENYLSGETLSQTWGITKVGADKYQYALSQKSKIKVGVIDTGIDYTHSELVTNLDTSLSKNFVNTTLSANDDHGHGTHVAGIIGAQVNGKGIFGVDSNTSLVALKVLSRDGYGSSYAIVDAINYAAANGIKVVNLSLGGNGTPSNDIICNAITNAKAAGTISVVAAGNENADVSTKVPAGCSDAITVGAVDSNLTKASFSNYGAEVDVSAPGVSIYSTYMGNTYATMAGTSMASPFVAGMVGAVLSSTGGTYDSIKSALIANGVAVNSSVNIGKFVSMSNTMNALGIADDTSYISPVTPPDTGTGTSSSGSTNTGTITPPVNVLPSLSLSSTQTTTNSYIITASASDSDGTIASYEFYENGTLKYKGTANKYNTTITTNTIIKVIVSDDKLGQTTKEIALVYTAPTNKLPTISSSFKAYNKTYNLVTTNASDSDGYITNFDVYVNNTLTYTYSNLQYANVSLKFYTFKGKSYTIKTVVKDNAGGISTKTITVK